jgi:hypothetical protein
MGLTNERRSFDSIPDLKNMTPLNVNAPPFYPLGFQADRTTSPSNRFFSTGNGRSPQTTDNTKSWDGSLKRNAPPPPHIQASEPTASYSLTRWQRAELHEAKAQSKALEAEYLDKQGKLLIPWISNMHYYIENEVRSKPSVHVDWRGVPVGIYGLKPSNYPQYASGIIDAITDASFHAFRADPNKPPCLHGRFNITTPQGMPLIARALLRPDPRFPDELKVVSLHTQHEHLFPGRQIPFPHRHTTG